MRTETIRTASIATCAAIGAGVAYALAGAGGNRRRALIRDKAARAGHKMRRASEILFRDLTNRTLGLAAELKPQLDDNPDDDVLVARVRSNIGRWASNPHAIEVHAHEGTVTLSGPVLADEEKDVVRRAGQVRGVKEVENRLQPHEESGNIPELQGGRRRRTPRFEYLQDRWAPAPRLLAGVAGASMIAYGIRERGVRGLGVASIGLALVARAAANVEFMRLSGFKGRGVIDVQKTVTVNAPREEVFSLWSNYSHFPMFMSHVKKVLDLGGGLSRWTVSGPAGTTVEFTARIADWITDSMLSWETEPGWLLQHSGVVRFHDDDGGTRVDVRLSYRPPAGIAGHALATLLGADPKTQLDEDLVRMKTFIETGIPPHDAASPELRI